MATSRPPNATSVLYVGEDPPTAGFDGVEIELVRVDSVPGRVPAADCVVVEEPGGLEALASLGETSVPTVLYDRAGDAARRHRVRHRRRA